MDFFEVVNNRKTIRNYENYIPPIEDIERIIDSARLAPSAMNMQNWEFIAIYNQEVKNKMAHAVIEVYDNLEKKLIGVELEKALRFKAHSTFFASAPVLIACVLKKSPHFFEGILEQAGYTKEQNAQMRPDSQLLSMGGAIENMSLTAHALNLGSCWMVAPVIAQTGFKEILNIENGDLVVSLLAVGKPIKTDTRSPKKELKEVMKIIK